MEGDDGNLTITRRNFLRWGTVAGLAVPAVVAGETTAVTSLAASVQGS